MGKLPRHHVRSKDSSQLHATSETSKALIEALINENSRLRELVTYLTELAIKDIVDDCPAPAGLRLATDQ
jgi:hypothetical protein